MKSARNKYRNRKITFDGEIFDSIKEYRRFCELRLLERAGAITGLERQKSFTLIPAQYADVNGKRKCVERACNYVADFVYWQDGKMIVEDTKGVKTKEYIIKRKLMLYLHNIIIREV